MRAAAARSQIERIAAPAVEQVHQPTEVRVGHRSDARPEQRVHLCQAAVEPAQERDWRGGGVAGCGDGVAAGGGVHEAVVVGGSVQVDDVPLGGDEGELGMYG